VAAQRTTAQQRNRADSRPEYRLRAVVLAMDRSNVDSVFVACRLLKRGGTLLNVDINRRNTPNGNRVPRLCHQSFGIGAASDLGFTLAPTQHDQVSIQPPSTRRLTPVTARFSSRKRVASTTSSTVTSSPSGVRARNRSSTSAGLPAQYGLSPTMAG
jgi:hypothetical protein